MLLSIIRRSFLNQKKAMAVMIVSVAFGTAIAASLVSLSFDIESKVSKELRSFGANILIVPAATGMAEIAGQKRYLNEEDIVKTKTIFWRHNIVGVAPFLDVHDREGDINILGMWYKKSIEIPGDPKGFDAGVGGVMPWWSVQGAWPEKEDEILAGYSIAERKELKIGDVVIIRGKAFRVSGIVNTGGKEDDGYMGDLSTVQKLYNMEGKISRVFVSALTTPMDDFAYKDPEKMTKKEYEKWYCTGYVTSIAKQLEEVFRGSSAKPIWPVAETEGRVLNKLSLLIYLLTAVALVSAALGVSTTMIMSLLRRTDEIGLMKAIGADRYRIITIFLTEAVIIGIMGGVLGYLLSLTISGYIGVQVFGISLEQRSVLFPISIIAAIVIAVMGIYLPIRRALSISPAVVLKGG